MNRIVQSVLNFLFPLRNHIWKNHEKKNSTIWINQKCCCVCRYVYTVKHSLKNYSCFPNMILDKNWTFKTLWTRVARFNPLWVHLKCNRSSFLSSAYLVFHEVATSLPELSFPTFPAYLHETRIPSKTNLRPQNYLATDSALNIPFASPKQTPRC